MMSICVRKGSSLQHAYCNAKINCSTNSPQNKRRKQKLKGPKNKYPNMVLKCSLKIVLVARVLEILLGKNSYACQSNDTGAASNRPGIQHVTQVSCMCFSYSSIASPLSSYETSSYSSSPTQFL